MRTIEVIETIQAGEFAQQSGCTQTGTGQGSEGQDHPSGRRRDKEEDGALTILRFRGDASVAEGGAGRAPPIGYCRIGGRCLTPSRSFIPISAWSNRPRRAK